MSTFSSSISQPIASSVFPGKYTRGATEEIPERFFVDATVLRLGKWLRFLGIDAPSWTPKLSLTPGACLLTKKRGRIKKVGNKIVVPHDRIDNQLLWFVERFPKTVRPERVGSRCMRCNHRLIQVPREVVRDLVPDYIWQIHTTFTKCPACQRIYWRGSHRFRMLAFLKEIGILPGGER